MRGGTSLSLPFFLILKKSISLSLVLSPLSFLSLFLSCLEWHSKGHGRLHVHVSEHSPFIALTSHVKNLHTCWTHWSEYTTKHSAFITRETCTHPAWQWARPPVLSPVPQQVYHSATSTSETKFACGHAFRLEQGHHRTDRGDDLGEVTTSPSNNLLLDLRHWNCHDQAHHGYLSQTNNKSVLPRTGLARLPKRTFLGPAPLALLQRQRQAAVTLRDVGCQLLVSRQEPLLLGEIAPTLHAFHHLAPALQ